MGYMIISILATRCEAIALGPWSEPEDLGGAAGPANPFCDILRRCGVLFSMQVQLPVAAESVSLLVTMEPLGNKYGLGCFLVPERVLGCPIGSCPTD